MGEIYTFDGWRLDTRRRDLSRPDGERVRLTGLEFDLLEMFCRRPQTVLPRDVINGELPRPNSAARRVDGKICLLRKKLIDRDMIKTIRDEGYYFAPEPLVNHDR